LALAAPKEAVAASSTESPEGNLPMAPACAASQGDVRRRNFFNKEIVMVNSLLLPQEAADQLRMKKQTLANWRCQGGGPDFIRAGSKIFYPIEKIKEYLARNVYNRTSDYGKNKKKKD
jgi:hypothetical protein